MNQRLLLGSLLVIALFSVGVVAEAERNYATVTEIEDTSATAASVSIDDGGVLVELAVENTMTEDLRVEFVHLSVRRANTTTEASVPYNGYRTVESGEDTLTAGIPERQFETPLESGETVRVEGFVAVEVYNGYRFRITLEPTEVPL